MPEDETRTRPWLIALAAMAAAVVLIPVVFGRTVVDSPATLDIGNQWIGFAAFVRDCYLAGRFPLWNPHDLCGTPFIAFAHTAALYPPTVLARLIIEPYPISAALDVFLHLALAATACFYFLRRDGSSPPAAFAGAMVYAFSGFVFGNINFPPSLHSSAWLPVWYGGSFALLDRPRFRDAGISAIGLAGMIYGGDLEMVVFGGLGLAFAAGLKWREHSLRPRSLSALAGAVAIGVLLASPQALPALELQSRSVRAGGAYTPEVSPLLLMLTPVTTVLPIPRPASLYPANHGLDPWYLGALPLLLGAISLRSPRARRPLWIVPAVIGYFLLFYVPPMSRVFSLTPVLGSLMVPFRLQPALWLFLLLAVTRSLDEWSRSETADPAARLLPAGRTGATAIVILAAAAAGVALAFGQARSIRILFALFAFASAWAVWRPNNLLIGALTPFRRRLLVIALIIIDLYLFGLTCLPLTDPAALDPDSRTVRIISGTSGRERYLIYSIRGIIDPGLPYHLGLRAGADTIDSFSRLPPLDAASRLNQLYPDLMHRDIGRLRRYDQMSLRDPRKIDPRKLQMLNDLNVVWLVGRFAWPHPGGPLRLEEVYSTETGDPNPLFIYRNLSAWPRALVRYDDQTAPVATLHPAPDEVILGPHPPGEAAVQISESCYPGWRAFSVPTGRETRIECDPLGLRRFKPNGATETVMRFEPASFRVGLWAALASLAAAVLVLILRRSASAPAMKRAGA